jgi:hypothetical protein
MTKGETAKMLLLLVGAYGDSRLSEMTSTVFHEALKDLDYPAVEAAAMTWATTEKFWPSPVEIRILALRGILNLAADAYEAWTRVEAMERKQQTTSTLDYATREALRRVGGQPALRTANDPTWIRRDFIAAYDGAVQDAITPATIASLRDGSATLKGLPHATPEHQGAPRIEPATEGAAILIVDKGTTVPGYTTEKHRRRIGKPAG